MSDRPNDKLQTKRVSEIPLVTRSKIIVLDDDPTGSQTVHSCLLLTRWDVDTLCRGLTDSVPIFFILTNTRACHQKWLRR